MDEALQPAPKLYPHDHIMKAVVLPFVPFFVKPNHVTVFRMLMTPVVLWLLVAENYTVGVPLFFLTALTDMLDGSLARVRNQITAWGILFDPLADKLLIGSVAILVGLKYFHPGLIFAAIILDIMPSIRWASVRNTGTIMMANWWGKTKMILQVTSLTALLLGVMLHVPALILTGEITLGVSLLFSLIAVITYSL
jgi:CDP-diacylglycerol--glycerol-3-phosphate 3-phosphatidyltransferase